MPSGPQVAPAAGHITLGTLCTASGVVFILLLHFYPPLFVYTEWFDGTGSKVPLLKIWPLWKTFIFASKIWCGIWNIITGAVGLMAREESSPFAQAQGKLYKCLSVFNAGFSVAVMGLNTYFVCYIFLETDLLSTQRALEDRQLWLLAFPCAGIALGFLEFVMSMFSSRSMGICCCESPTAERLAVYIEHGNGPHSDNGPPVSATGRSRSEFSNTVQPGDGLTCKICMDRQFCITFRPCGHLCVCQECSASLSLCPICRGGIQERQLTFLT